MDDFVHSFLFQNSEIKKEGNNITASFAMDSSKEGWVGIPHGGIGMGAIMELVSGQYSHKWGLKYPVQCSFRMGGAEVRTGDSVTVAIHPTELGISGRISLENAAMPYITGEVVFGAVDSEGGGQFKSYVPKSYSQMEGELECIPYYRNCFVCGVERELPGLKRKFHLWGSPNGHIVCAFAGFNDEDSGTIHLFNRNGFLHPIVMLSVLDETMGWGGFFTSANGGVSVRLNYSLLRRVGVNEKLVFFGRGERIKGSIDRRMFFWASGCAAVMNEDRSFDVVAESSGQWMAISSLTDQMKKELIPRVYTRRVFEIVQKQGKIDF